MQDNSLKIIASGSGATIRFCYINWKGEHHTYEVESEAVEYGSYVQGGLTPDDSDEKNWVMHGVCIKRDGEEREGHPRRTFLLHGMMEDGEHTQRRAN